MEKGEMLMKPATFIATIFLSFISIAQLIRVIFQVQVTANGVVVPLWISVIACIVTGMLAVLLWSEHKPEHMG
jgi:uncharacterized protein with PQ loop repeat